MAYVLAEAAVGMSLRPYMRQAREVLTHTDELESALVALFAGEAQDGWLYAARAMILLCIKHPDGCACGAKALESDNAELVRYCLYQAIDDACTLIDGRMEAGERLYHMEGEVISLLDDLYALGVLTVSESQDVQSTTERQGGVSADVPYKEMVLSGCRQAQLIHSPWRHIAGMFLRLQKI